MVVLQLETGYAMKILKANLAVIDMNFLLYADIILLVDIPDEGLAAGDVGTVVERHAVPNLEPGYSVEFSDILGDTVAVVTVAASVLRRPTVAARPAVRQASVEALV